MRKFATYFMMFVVMTSFVPAHANVKDPVSVNSPEVTERVNVLMGRLNEIKDMDKSDLSRADKKELRKEVKAIKEELRSTGNGVYLSIGAIIIIILLLILIL